MSVIQQIFLLYSEQDTMSDTWCTAVKKAEKESQRHRDIEMDRDMETWRETETYTQADKEIDCVSLCERK